LVEAIVVIAILAVIAAFIAPKFTTVRQTEARLAVDEVADLMRMWAYRNSVMSQQVGIWRSPETGVLRLMIRDIDARRPDDGPIWQEDRLSMPVTLPAQAELTEVYIDGESRNLGDWFVQSNADGSRPRLELAIKTGTSVIRLLVEPYSNSIVRSDDRSGGLARHPVDLDSEGEDRVSW